VQFNAPSFSAGLILGAALVALVPKALDELEQTPVNVEERNPVTPPEVIFDFDELLTHSEVSTDTSAYPVEFEKPGGSGAGGGSYQLQAASFHSLAEAVDLRDRLSRQDLPTRVNRVMVGDKPWYRVTVGPFDRQIEAERAITRLRENNLSPLPLRRG
jgi:cell division protein FtsN